MKWHVCRSIPHHSSPHLGSVLPAEKADEDVQPVQVDVERVVHGVVERPVVVERLVDVVGGDSHEQGYDSPVQQAQRTTDIHTEGTQDIDPQVANDSHRQQADYDRIEESQVGLDHCSDNTEDDHGDRADEEGAPDVGRASLGRDDRSQQKAEGTCDEGEAEHRDCRVLAPLVDDDADDRDGDEAPEKEPVHLIRPHLARGVGEDAAEGDAERGERCQQEEIGRPAEFHRSVAFAQVVAIGHEVVPFLEVS